MDKVKALPASPASESLLDAHMGAIADGYNRLLDVGQFDRESVQMMVGFLSAATITFRTLCNEALAVRFEHAANDLRNDWRTLPHVIPDLCAALNSDRRATRP